MCCKISPYRICCNKNKSNRVEDFFNEYVLDQQWSNIFLYIKIKTKTKLKIKQKNTHTCSLSLLEFLSLTAMEIIKCSTFHPPNSMLCIGNKRQYVSYTLFLLLEIYWTSVCYHSKHSIFSSSHL